MSQSGSIPRNGMSMSDEAKELRDGIFSLYTRRFGTVAELLIEKLYGLSDSIDQHHDATDANGNRIEIKFSRLLKKNQNRITKDNVVEEALKSSTANRALAYKDTKHYKFDCNIQQVKRTEFDILYYGIFFADKIAVFSINSDEILDLIGYSDFQHKGNEGEGQFHITNDTLDYHMNNYFKEWVTYEKLYNDFLI